MDLEGQGRIRTVVEQMGTEDVVAVLGANSAAAVEMTALTLKSGDPSYAGPLAGIALGIPSFHILEPEIVGQIDAAVYERELALSALAMDVDEVVAPMKSIREG
jgi:glycine reductase